MIEPVDTNYSNVTLIYRGNEQTENVVVLGNAHGYDYKRNQMKPIEGTSIWHMTNAFLNVTEITYDYASFIFEMHRR
ncbi:MULTISPECIES: hypothetical protein [unclassified Fusibacter]|uniref:hypothetical protein n=1 Tax=unclassified Fusibacter TaxID=2624464 RepID=UPI0010127A67|nr:MULTISPECIES: hypothetical protein [unclassified Fusibacter]MCK8058948.1 hypothetical protein [Fusibacter sp. A2]NPE22024.1 hypothetical protein [Fusibacter sp. A1]RXV61589.1 hypothetical protein DWB64_09275 [Fusibacter sp. A1]